MPGDKKLDLFEKSYDYNNNGKLDFWEKSYMYDDIEADVKKWQNRNNSSENKQTNTWGFNFQDDKNKKN